MKGFFEQSAKQTHPDWKCGVPIEEIKRVANFFRELDKPITNDSIASVGKHTAAQWIAAKSIVEGKHKSKTLSMMVVERVMSRRAVKDFSREIKFNMMPGDIHIKRVATIDIDTTIEQIRESVGNGRCFIELWEEDRIHRQLADKLKASWLCSKIRSTSEIVGVYRVGGNPVKVLSNLYDDFSLTRLKLAAFDVAGFADKIPTAEQFKNHYSNYNKEKSWSALALRGYGGDSFFIEKPTEMLRSWQKKNPDKLKLQLADTPLRKQLSFLEPLIASVPGRKHRVRLMRLTPGGGELQRHTDNCDPDVGTLYGRLLRIHIPLLTNPDVKFTVWSQRGVMSEQCMGLGEVWYLDTRKPHRAVNAGSTDRIHLVMDVESSPEALKLFPT